MEGLRDYLRRYVSNVKAMTDPILVNKYGMERLNDNRAYWHHAFCHKYDLTREQTLAITDNLPIEKSVDEIVDWMAEKLSQSAELTVWDDAEKRPWVYLGMVCHHIYYIAGDDLPKPVYDIVLRYKESVNWIAENYTKCGGPEKIPFDDIKRGWHAVLYLCGKKGTPDEFLNTVAHDTLKKVCLQLSDFRTSNS